MPNDIDAGLVELRRRSGVSGVPPTENPDGFSVEDGLAQLRHGKTNTEGGGGDEPEQTPVPQPKPIVSESDITTDELDLSLRHASTANPTAEAANRKLAKGLDVPKELLPEDANEQLFRKQNNPEALQRTHPAVARYMSSIENASIVGQDVEELKGIESLMRRFGADPLLALVKGSVSAVEGVTGLGSIARAGISDLLPPVLRNAASNLPVVQKTLGKVDTARRAVEGTADFKRSKEIIDTFLSPAQQEANRKVQEAQGFMPTLGTSLANPSTIAHTVLESLPGMLASGAFAQQLIKELPKLAPLLAGAAGEGLFIAGTTAEGIRGETADGDLTRKQAVISGGTGVVSAGINVLSGSIMQKMGVTDIDTALAAGTLKQALDVSGMPTRLATRILTGAVGEGLLEELPQSAVEQIAQNVALEKPWDEGVPEAMAVGLLAGAATGAGVNVISTPASSEVLNRAIDNAAAKEVKNMSRAQAAVGDKESLESYGKAVSESALRSRDPEAFKEFVRTMSEEDGNLSEVYVDAAQLNESLAQSGMTPEELEQKMPDLAKELKVAQDIQGEVRISIEDYATYLAGSKAEVTLIDHLRTSPDGMTFGESQSYFQAQEKSLTEQAEQLVSENSPVLSRADFQAEDPGADYNQFLREHENKVEAFAADSLEVHDTILKGLNATGRFTKAVNASYAIPFQQFFAVNAARQGVMPSEMFKTMPLNFRGINVGGEVSTNNGTLTQLSEDQELHTPEELKELNRKYLEALGNGERNKAAQLVAEAAGIVPLDSGFERGGAHDPAGPDSGAPLFDLTGNGNIYPDDVYSANGLRSYGTGEDAMDREAHRLVQVARGKPNQMITVYRAVEKERKGSKILPGDWVTTVRAYAKDHGEGHIDGEFKIVKQLVTAKEIFTSGDSWLEYGYHPQPNFPPLVKRDANGDVIPLAERDFSAYRTEGTLKQFAGPLAATADAFNLERATELEATGMDNEDIRQLTGWFRGVDDKWRFEIDDSEATLKTRVTDRGDTWGDMFFNTVDAREDTLLSDVIDHPMLFAAYPDLERMHIGLIPGDNGASFVAGQGSKLPSIRMGANVSKSDLLSFLMHEVQHGLQNTEGFARGGSPELVVQLKQDQITDLTTLTQDPAVVATVEKIDLARVALAALDLSQKDFLTQLNAAEKELGKDVPEYQEYKEVIDTLGFLDTEQDPVEGYRRLAGEIEARNTQERLGLNVAAREILSPQSTQDLPDSEAIVIFRNSQVKNLPTAKNIGDPKVTGLPAPDNIVPADPNILAQSTFFSALEREIGGLKKIANKKGEVKPDQAIAWINARQKEGKFTKSEVEAVGVLDWLSSRTDPVEVAGVESFIQLNGVRVDEVTLTEGTAGDSAALASEIRDTTEELRADESTDGLDEWQVTHQGVVSTLDVDPFDLTDAELFSALEVPSDETGGTKFEQYTLEGGENYKELLLTLPGERKFVSDSHFDEENILAHIRFNERKAGDENVLFIEEIQSDWAQAGRKEGFIPDPARAVEIRARMKEIEVEREDGARIPPPEHRDEWVSLSAELYESQRPIIASGPFVKETKDWTALAMKRMMRYAAEEGFDRIAWTTGAQQADRYDLSKKVNSVNYSKNSDGTFEVRIRDLNDDTVWKSDATTGEELEGVIGKEPTDKILKGEGESVSISGDIKKLSGLDLKIGGEGMITFYDKIVPQVTNSLLKKLKGPKVEVLFMGRGDSLGRVGDQLSFEITPELRATILQGLPLFQKERASYNPATFTISLLEGSDLSSTIHEGGHFYLEALADMAGRPDAPEQVKADFEKSMAWFGIEDPNSWRTMTLEQKRGHHEQWAQSFERYALEGKAPTTEMQPVFARFRAFMLSVYKDLKKFLEQNPLAGKLNDEIRSVFDRLLAAEEGIRDTERAREYAPLFATAEEAGTTQQAFEEYLEEGSTATARAIDDLSSRSLRDMRWLSNAKDKVIRTLQAEAKDKREAIRAEVINEVMMEPVNQARTFLRKGILANEDGTVTQAQETFKLNTKDIKSLKPDADLKKIRGMTSPDGIHPDLAAQMFGFDSGDALLTELMDGEKPKDKIDGLTDATMLERHGDLIDNRAVERAAEKAIHNEARARFMATGLKMLTKSSISAPQLNRAAKQAAESAISAKKVREITPGQYARAEARANKEAVAKAAKDPNAAIRAQRAALLNNRLVKASTEAQAEVDRILKFLRKFDKSSIRKKLDIEYAEQITDLLGSFDLRRGVTKKAIDKRQSLADWLDQQQANGFEPAIDPSLMADLKTKHFKDMTLEELRGLAEGVKQIEHIGRLKKKLLTAKDKREFAVRVDEADTSIRVNANRTVKERGTPTDVVGVTARWFRRMAAEHRKMNSIIREMDGGKDNGVMWNLFSRGMNEAGDFETDMKQTAATDIAALFEGLPKDETIPGNLYARKKLIPGTNMSMTHEQRVMFALNWGNEGNRQRILDGGITGKRALSTADAQKVLDTLTKADWDFVQGTWDYIGGFKERVSELEKKLTGLEPEWVEASPVVTKFGTFKGGYFPAKYDAELSTRSESLEAVTDLRMGMKGAFGSSATRSGYVQSRADAVINRPLLLSFNVISQHISEVTHRLAWQPWLVDANRLLKALDEPIRTHYGPEILTEMRNTVEDIAQGDAPAKNATELAINRLRVGSTIVGMGWRFSTALLQPSGLSQSMSRIGTGWVARGMGEFVANPLAAGRKVNEKSKLMRDRSITMNREINEVLNRIRAGEKVSTLTASYFTMIGKMQRTVDIPTWIGAHEKALKELKFENAINEHQRQEIDDKAVSLADQAVIDSQSGGQLKDLARVQRGSPVWKLFTNFYSYFSAAYNLNVEAVRRTNFKSPSEVGLFAIDMLLINVLPVIYSVILREMLRPECEEDLECYADKLAQEQIGHIMGQMVLLREAGAAVSVATGGDGYGYQGPAGLRFFGDLYKAGTQVSQGEADFAAFKAVNSVGGALLHYPAGQVNATLEGIMAIENGDVEGAGILPALLAGPPK